VRLNVALVAIERPDGLLVERLLDAGLRVLAMHPNQVAAARARFRVSGGKSDRFDALVLCELARTDNHRFRVLEPDSDETRALRALTRAREDLVHARVALSNQLRAELERFWPGPIGLFQKLDSPISLAFLERYPSPADARTLGEQRLSVFLARQRYSGHKKPGELLAKLRRAPEGRVGEAELAARRALVLSLLAAIKPLVAQIKQLDQQIASAVHEHPDGAIFLSLFKGSVVTAAELLAEIGDCRARYPTRDALAARRRLVLGFVAMIRTLNGQIKDLEREIRTQVRGHPDGPIFLSLFKSPASVITAAELLAEIGDCRQRYPTRDALASDAGQAAVAMESGKWKTPASGGRATSAYASRSAGSRTAAATGIPGPKTSTPKPASAATSTPARSAPSDAPGAASCGNAGATTPPTTPRDPAHCSATSRSSSPPRRAQCPTSSPPRGWPASLSPNGRSAWAEREALDRKPPSATPQEVDVMKGRVGSGGPVGVRQPGGRKSALRPEPHR
jgi:transposase